MVLHITQIGEVWDAYRSLLFDGEASGHELDWIAGRFVSTRISIIEFENGHVALLRGQDEAALARAARVRRVILQAYDDALIGYRQLEEEYRTELLETRRSSRSLQSANRWLTATQSDLRGQIAVQSRKLTERSEELKTLNINLSAQKGELQSLIYSLSHDLKAPLVTIESLLREFVEESQGGAEDHPEIKDAIKVAARGRRTIDSLLEYATTIGEAIERKPVDLNRVVDDITSDLSAQISETGGVVAHDPLPTVSGSELQLRLMLQNLISNGLKFHAPDRPPRVMVADEGVRGIGFHAISVSDNGIGIAPEYHERIFSMFGRLHATSEYEGSGIGLSLCQRVVENHDGRIQVISEVGAGTKFVIVLPI